ncbi:MAG: FeoC-like transcriptional regulator [Gammaproteobacteria bacterium]|nr:FeoC-like transcriptional regulator [Gammaproteobacteria bacterium]
MILQQVLHFIESRDTASLGEIAAAVDASPDAVRSMLATLQRKGLVHRYEAVAGCGSSCTQCAQGEIELYRCGPAPVLSASAASCARAR